MRMCAQGSVPGGTDEVDAARTIDRTAADPDRTSRELTRR
jgi:hypothetical protein